MRRHRLLRLDAHSQTHVHAHAHDTGWEQIAPWGWAVRGPANVAPLTLSRVMIEGTIRARVRGGVHNLTLLQDTRMTGLMTKRNGDRVRVTGITTSRWRRRRGRPASRFREHLDKLLSPALAREIDRAKPLSSIHSNRSLFNRARHFERWSHEVGGFVSLGDSAVTFNPYHGQGMSMAAVAANILGDLCAKTGPDDPYALTRRFHRAQWKALCTSWDIATGIDMEWPGTCGKRPFAYNLSLVFGTIVCRAAAEFPRVMGLMGPVYQLLAPVYTLLRPEMIARVIYAEICRRLGRTAPLTAPEDTSGLYLPAPAAPASAQHGRGEAFESRVA